MDVPCPHCHNPIKPEDFFCPTCGQKLKDPPLSTGIGKQIALYLFAFFLPPFGLIPAFKYLKDENPKAKTIGIVLLSITVVVLLVTVLLTAQVISEATKVIKSSQQSTDIPGYNY